MTEEMYEFLARVRTFELGSWLHMSYSLTPYVLAARGFVFQDSQTVECHICHFTISFENMKIGEDNEDEESKIRDLIKQHKKDCIYSGLTTPDEDLYILRREELYSNMDAIFQKLNDSYNFHSGKLPIISGEAWGQYLVKYESVFSKNNPKFQDRKEINLPFLLSIFGWELAKEKTKLMCIFCGRTVNISDYETTEQGSYKILPDTLGGKQRLLQPVEEHRYFCIWGHREDFGNPPRLFGWQICLKHLYDKLLDVERGWAEREKFQEVTQIKQRFSKILQQFSQKTKQSLSKFNQLVEDNKPTVEAGQEQELLQRKMEESKQAVQNILDEVEGFVKPLAKKIKYT